jgi:hypothetical protein
MYRIGVQGGTRMDAARGAADRPDRRLPDTSLSEDNMAHERFQDCIDACDACAAACDHCATACLGEDDVKMMARCIALDMDCAQICRLASAFMARGSESAAALCRQCAEVCAACGDECGKHQHEHCQQCAVACRRCADACRAMAAAA